jgi:diguanylate cyclase (GGDEF)-like protein
MSATTFKLFGFFAAMLIFAFDAMMPLGLAAGVPYVLLVLLSLTTQRSWDAVGMAIVGSLLTVIGYFISEPGDIHYMVLINRGIALAVIWAACIAMVLHFSSLAELKTMAIFDHLTGLYNRHYFFSQAERILKGRMRYKTPVTLMLIDLDDFKKINDTYGHDAGDHVLKHVADTLKQCLRDVDVIARIGGEEFVVLLPSTVIEAGNVVAEKLRSAIENKTFTYQQQEIMVTVSIGVVEASQGRQLVGDLLKAADKLLYQAKHRGKNYVAIEGITVFPQLKTVLNMASR